MKRIEHMCFHARHDAGVAAQRGYLNRACMPAQES
jgi:hypothetical protein